MVTLIMLSWGHCHNVEVVCHIMAMTLSLPITAWPCSLVLKHNMHMMLSCWLRHGHDASFVYQIMPWCVFGSPIIAVLLSVFSRSLSWRLVCFHGHAERFAYHIMAMMFTSFSIHSHNASFVVSDHRHVGFKVEHIIAMMLTLLIRYGPLYLMFSSVAIPWCVYVVQKIIAMLLSCLIKPWTWCLVLLSIS